MNYINSSYRVIGVLAILILILVSSSSNAGTKELLDTLDQKLAWVEYRYQVENWERYTGGAADSLEFYTDLYQYITYDKATLTALNQGKAELSDPSDIRAWELIQGMFSDGDKARQKSISDLRDSLSAIDINFRAEQQGTRKTSAELYTTYRTHSNRAIREEAYRGYQSPGNELADGLGRLIRLRNRDAKDQGFNNYLRYQFKELGLDVENYIKLLSRLETLSRQPYQEILNQAKERVNVTQLEEWDIAFSWSGINNEIDAYFPVDSQVVFVKRGLNRIDFDLDKLPIYFDLEPREGKSQFAYAFFIQPPYDQRVMANLSNGLYSTRVLLHEIGHAIHSAFISQDRPAFRTSLSGIWTEGIAQFIANFTDDPIWLTEVAGVPRGLVNRYLAAKKEQDIVYLRTTLLRLQFELEAYNNPQRDLNKLYWDLFERYMMLPRHEELRPWAAIIHYTTHPVYLQNYLFADIIAFQTKDYLVRSYGNITDNPMTKAFLVQNYMRFGSRYDWRELLERGTESGLNPEPLIKALGLN